MNENTDQNGKQKPCEAYVDNEATLSLYLSIACHTDSWNHQDYSNSDELNLSRVFVCSWSPICYHHFASSTGKINCKVDDIWIA